MKNKVKQKYECKNKWFYSIIKKCLEIFNYFIIHKKCKKLDVVLKPQNIDPEELPERDGLYGPEIKRTKIRKESDLYVYHWIEALEKNF